MSWLIIKGGMALFAGIFVSLIMLPVMADYAYNDSFNNSWDTAGETARDQRDAVIAQYRWFPIFISGLVVVWMVWSASKKDPTVEETAEW